jgi:general secretion pathway protein A
MYKSFFGFKERPFQLVPNPAYLFLSRSHEEAMAHLTYAISQGDGFVELTGEVGTGKTTICRAFLESLDANTEVAYVINPMLDSIQLLKTINDEFGINAQGDNTKDLIDTLNGFLMEEKAKGKKVVLLIDEAQNLSKEVLEQLRLLSNLETNTGKLLQIILVGQPELGEMLDSHELRQLGQRITLSCYLNPLTYKETTNYIRHRIHTASQKSGVPFTRHAILTIYRYSGGVPRLINIACDRALLTAYGLNRHKITGTITKTSIRELAGRGDVKRYSLQKRRRPLLYLSMVVLVLLVILIYNPKDTGIRDLFKPAVTENREMKTQKTLIPEGIPPINKDQGIGLAEPVIGPLQSKDGKAKAEMAVESVSDLRAYLVNMDTLVSRQRAIKIALDLWGTASEINRNLETLEDDRGFFNLVAKQNGFSLQIVEKDFELIQKLNLPAILEFLPPGSLSPRFLTVSKIDKKGVTLRGGKEDKPIIVMKNDLEAYWAKTAYIPWKNFLNYEGLIPLRAPRDSIITLKMLMQDIGYHEIEISPYYDEPLKMAVKQIQEKHGLFADGIVGPLTKIALYNEKKSLNIPHLTDRQGQPNGEK